MRMILHPYTAHLYTNPHMFVFYVFIYLFIILFIIEAFSGTLFFKGARKRQNKHIINIYCLWSNPRTSHCSPLLWQQPAGDISFSIAIATVAFVNISPRFERLHKLTQTPPPPPPTHTHTLMYVDIAILSRTWSRYCFLLFSQCKPPR